MTRWRIRIPGSPDLGLRVNLLPVLRLRRECPSNRQCRQISSQPDSLWIGEQSRCQQGDFRSWHPHGGQLYQCDLTRLKTNAVAMVRIRDFVRQAEHGYCVAMANDDELLEQFSRLLDSNRWRICSLVSVDQPTTHAEVESQCPSFDEPSPPTRQTAPPPPVAQADSDNSTFPTNHDATAQTLALVEAAQSGVPFCEECAKLRLSQR